MNDLRVFISSTFRDLQEEREHLVRKTFPEIRALCRERGITFTEVDLRWGLTDEDVVLGQVVRTCLEEIDKCRPYFIGITGERYGYVPDVVDIYKDAELLSRYPWIEDAAMQGSSILDLEFRHGALNDGNDRARFFARRTRRGHESEVPEEEHSRIEALKCRVRDAGFDVEEFRDPVSLGEAVYDALVEIIDRDFAGAAPPNELERERASHEAFAASRRHAYIPNPAYLTSLNSWHEDPEAPPLVIYAESGSGKSSLVSFWCQQLRRRDCDAFIVEHYVGIGAGSSDHYAIMRHVMGEIKERFARAEEIPTKPEELEQHFANWLGFTVGAPMLLILDGINQLSGRALELHWLPPMMPPGVKLIITSTVEQTLVDLRRRGWRELAMQPLTEREREGVIVRYLAEYHKALSKEQVSSIAEDVKCAHPLFLRTLLEELRIDSSHEALDERIALYLGTSGTEDLFQKVLERMEDDYSTRAVREVMSLIWCSRAGLSEEDLQALTGVSRLKLSTMLGGLDYHLVHKEGALTFFHDYLRRAVGKRYVAEERLRMELWRRLGVHFESQPVTLRSTTELVHALEGRGEHERLLGTIADVERFDLLFRGETQYEVLAHWAGVDSATTARKILEKVRAWHGSVSGERELKVLGRVSTLLSALGCVSDALGIDRERLRLAVELDDRLEQGRALSSMCGRLLGLGDLVGAEEHAIRAEAIAREIGDREGIESAVGDRGDLHAIRSEYEQALACYAESEAIACEIGDRQYLGACIGNRGNVHSSRGEHEQALACFIKSESIARELGDRKSVATAVGNRGLVHLDRGEYQQALACLAEQEAIAREFGNRRSVASSVGNRGNVHSICGEYEQALACYAEQEAIAREIGDLRGVEHAVGNRGIVHFNLGEHEKALACFAEQEAIAREVGDRRSVAYSAGYRGTVLLKRDEYEQALACFAEQEAISRDLSDPSSVAAAMGNRGSVCYKRGEYDQALACFAEQEVIASELGERRSAAIAVGNQGNVHLIRGEYEEALSCYARHEAAAREIGDRRNLGFFLAYASRAFLECALLDEMPPYLNQHITGSDQWRMQCLDAASRRVREALSIAQEIATEEDILEAEVVLGRIEAAEGHNEAARVRLLRVLDAATREEQRAECHYWLWKLTLDPAVDHRGDAGRLYAELYERSRTYEFKLRLDEFRAAALTTTPSEQARALSSMSGRLIDLGDLVGAEEHAARAEAIARASGSREGVANSIRSRVRVHMIRGEYEPALTCLAELETIGREIGDLQSVAAALGNCGNVHMIRGEYEQALACFVQQEAIAREIGDRRIAGSAVGFRGVVYAESGQRAEALACFAEQEAIAREMGDRQNVASVVGNCGLVHWEQAELDLALACFAEQEAIARQIGDRRSVSQAVGSRGLVHWDRNEHDLALTCFAEQEVIAREIGDRRSLVGIMGNRGIAHVSRSEYESAVECFSEGEAIAREIGDRANLRYCLSELANVFLQCSSLAEIPPGLARITTDAGPWRTRCLGLARRHAQEALSIAQEIGVEEMIRTAELSLARIDAAENDIAAETARPG